MADAPHSVTPRSWQDIDKLVFLGAEAPRYTSYPSAHHFGNLSPETYAAWLKRLTPDQSIGLYLHVPFCEQMCSFCGCNTRVTLRYDPVATYVDALLKEIGMVSDVLGFRPRVHAIHFGGGSPSILSPLDMGRLFEALHTAFAVTPEAELSIELDPRRITSAKAAAYKALGINRVSLGVQDTDPDVQLAIGRVQPVEIIKNSLSLLRSYGLDDIGIDLVYGLPAQTLESLKRTLAHVRELSVSRIAAFSYAHVPWVKKHQTLIDTDALPDTALKAQMFLTLSEALQAQGYVAIGMDHFARLGDGLTTALMTGTLRRNFMGYTDLPNDNLLGFGASSIGELEGGIAQNIAQSTSYVTHITDGELPTTRGWVYRKDDKVRGAVISALMCYFRADVGQILKNHGYAEDYLDAELRHLVPFMRAGLVTRTGRLIEFHSELKMLIRPVAGIFDAYIHDDERPNRYSKVA
jgi:oxygen-independent coproporphyrinogen III oxidase